ncbi:MAG: hypothetical protein M1368_07155 [Thaumarchaeota archaeon]|nr:hypothetical protein [Nitrososphaerota archaeon]
MRVNKVLLLFFTIVIVGGGTYLFALTALDNSGSPSFSNFPLETPGSASNYFFGSVGANFTGWLIPANTLILTSYKINHSVDRFVSATLNVFPYNIAPNTSLYLGLYVNGELSANQSYVLAQNVAHPPTLQENLSSQAGQSLAGFTPSLEGYSVTLFPRNSLAANTNVTITVFVTNPIWVQIDSGAIVHSYEKATAIAVPNSLIVDLAIAPYTLSIQGESNAA